MSNETVNKDVKLEKKLSPLNVWALAFGCIIGWGAFVLPGSTFLKNAGPMGTLLAMLAAAVMMIIIAFNYHYMINMYPVAGGEFAYSTNAFGRTNGFVCAWFLGLSYVVLVPMNAMALALIGRNLLGSVFQFGFHYTVSGYDIYLGEILLAVAALLVFAFLSIRGVKFAGIFQMVISFALMAGVLVIFIAAIVSSKSTMLKLTPAYYPGSSELSGFFAVLAVAPYCFVGFDTVPQAAEEFNFSHRKIRIIMIISILFGAFVYIALNTVTAAVVPEGYANWVEYINDVPNLTGLESLPTFNAAYELLGTWGLVFLGIAVLAATLSGIVGFYMAASRLLYSMAKERVLPAWFGKLHPKYKTPVNAILFHMIIALIAPFFGRVALGWLVDMSSIGAAIGYGYTSAATVVYSSREKKVFPVITGILGAIFAICFAVILVIPIPGLNCSLGIQSYICLGIWIVLGAAFFLFMRRKNKKNKETRF